MATRNKKSIEFTSWQADLPGRGITSDGCEVILREPYRRLWLTIAISNVFQVPEGISRRNMII